MAKITIEELSGSLKEYLNGLGLTEAQVQELIDKFEDEKIGDISQLSTEEKGSLVGAINELFQSANNGKQIIADAIGSPLTEGDTFAAMGNSINNMTIDFRNALALKGVNAPADKFETLINRIDEIVQSGNVLNNQVMVSGEYTLTEKFGGFDSNDVNTLTVSTNLSFEPEYFIIYASGLSHEHSSSGYYWKPDYFTLTTDVPTIHPICAAFDTTAYLGHSFHLLLSYDKNSFTLTAQDGINGIWYGKALYLPAGTVIKWYAIGSSQLPNNGGERTITPSTTDQVLPDGYYSGNITVKGDSDLKPENIVEGVEIFGVTGNAVLGYRIVSTNSDITFYQNSLSGLTVKTTLTDVMQYTTTLSGVFNIRASSSNSSYGTVTKITVKSSSGTVIHTDTVDGGNNGGVINLNNFEIHTGDVIIVSMSSFSSSINGKCSLSLSGTLSL